MMLAAALAVAVSALGVAARAALALSHRHAVARRLPGDLASRAPALGTPAVDSRRSWKLPEPPAAIAAALVDAALPVPPATAWAGWLVLAGVGSLVAAVAGGPGLAGVIGVSAVAGPAGVVRSRRGQAGRRLERALPGALESVARSLRSGASLRQAVEETGTSGAGGPQLSAELSRAARETAQGASLVTALEGIAVRRPLPGVRLAVAALCLGAETGGAQARAVDGVAATVRERLAVAAELRALAAQARISALVIGLAPLGFGAFAAATDPRASHFLLHTPAGLGLLSAGLVLDGVGWLWMQRLARVAA